MMKVEKIKQIEEILSSRYIEREEEIRGLILAALTGQHLFLLGSPGTGKSSLIRDFSRLCGGKCFSTVLSQFTTPEQLFGVVNLPKLKEGILSFNTEGFLPDSNFAFLDEIWKANSAILNTLLPIMEERIFMNGSSPMKLNLVSLFAASNEMPQPEVMALFDRFALRYLVKQVSQEQFVSLLTNGDVNNHHLLEPIISLSELMPLQEEVNAVVVPEDIFQMIGEIRRLCSENGILVSDRRFVRSIKVIKATAFLNERDAVIEDDLEILKNILWDTPENIPQITKIVVTAFSPDMIKAWEILEEIEKEYNSAVADNNRDSRISRMSAAIAVIKEGIRQLNGLNIKESKKQEFINKARSIGERLRNEVMSFIP